MKTALITGASRGLGKALANKFNTDQYELILHSTAQGDLTYGDTISRLVELAERKDVDILINNAGAYLNEQLENMTIQEIKRVIDLNLIAPILLTKAIWPIFVKKQSGLVININSLAGINGSDGETIYCASKHGLAGFLRALQFEATRNNIRVIDVYLGSMKTDMAKDKNGYEKFICPDDAAETIYTLCNEYKSLRITDVTLCRREY
jgi:short-subunit dehydrogenase